MQLRLSASTFVIAPVMAALKTLTVDYLDLLLFVICQILIPRIERDCGRANHNLIQKVRSCNWGTSEWSAQQITQALRYC